MNYYEHHLGDYMRDTAHLSMLEDAAYRRLLDAYYVREKPLPADLRECYKLARAASKQEREAVAYVLREFFVQEGDALINRRAAAEIARYHESEPDREAKRENERERQRRTRERRRELFNQLREAGIVPTYDAPMSELQTLALRVTSRAVTTNVTRDITATQTPDTRHQEKETPPTPSRGKVHEFPPGFERLWAAYPRKVGKDAAARAFAKRKPDATLLETMLKAVAGQRESRDWTKDGGQFIPHLSTWLNEGRWMDETTGAAPANDIFAGAM